jgi:glycosyltransferase involved in cell wall biosynthesis
MRILYIHQYFRTPEEGGGIRSYYLAKGMADAGHRVDLFTAHNDEQYKKALVDGIHVHYLPVRYTQEYDFGKRIIAFMKFVWLAVLRVGSLEKADLCYVSSTPLTTGLIALYLRWKHKIPYYFEVRDLWPEAPVQLGAIQNYWLKRLLYRLERKIYRHARAVITLSPGAQQHVEKYVPHKPVLFIPNMADCRFFNKGTKNPYHEVQFGVSGKFVVTYCGAIGKVNRLQNLLDAAEACQRNLLYKVVFLVVGEGSELKTIRRETTQRQLQNIRFLPFQNKYGLLSVLNVTDAAYISFARQPVLQHCSPNKLFDALAAGKLCITTVGGWMQEMLEENRCGFYADPEQPEGFVRQITPFINDLHALEEFQENARRLAERQFSRQGQVEKLLELLEGTKKTAPKVYTLPV